MVNGFFEVLPKIVIAIVVFLVIMLIARLVRNFISKRNFSQSNEELSVVLARIAYWFLLIVGIFVALTIVLPSLTPAQMISTLGIGGLAIGFAFKDIFQNLLAGILILVRQPFKIGDEIKSGDHVGKVENIETRATFIRTYDGQRVIIPNSQIYSQAVKVITAYSSLRSQYDVGIGYGDDIGEAKRIMLDTLKGIDGVLGDPAPDVLVWDLAASWITIRCRWWASPERSNIVQLHSKVLEAIANALTDAGIDMPYETKVTLFHDQTEETDGDRAAQREGWPTGANNPKPRRGSTVRLERDQTKD